MQIRIHIAKPVVNYILRSNKMIAINVLALSVFKILSDFYRKTESLFCICRISTLFVILNFLSKEFSGLGNVIDIYND